LLAKGEKISETDAKILKILMKESRTSFTEIAKECKISVSSARTRYSILKKEGIIKGEIIQINPHALGYKCICDIGITTAVGKEREVVESLKENPLFGNAIGPWGKFNIKVMVALHSIDQLTGILQELESDTRIKTVDTLIWAEATNMDHPENLMINNLPTEREKEEKKKYGKNDPEETQFDEIDRKIAKILSEKSRTPASQIGEQLNLSTKSVIQRYKKLRRNLLTLSTLTVDLNKLGYNAMVHAFIKVANKSKMKDIHTQMLQIPNLLVTIKLIGHYDFLTISVVSDFRSYFKLKDQIHAIEGIEKEEIFLWEVFPTWPANLFTKLL
jgi:DNA-binding Lrp family transcriptional regulator